MIKKRKIYLWAAAFLLVGIIGSTYAFYSSNTGLDNLLITKGSEVFISEYFHPEDLWLPGETKIKEVRFGNQSEVDQVIRFKVVEEWFNRSDNTPWTWAGSYTPPPVTINYTGEITGGSWSKIGEYYYYNKILTARQGPEPTETPAVIDSVTFSQALSNNQNFGDDFSDKACHVSIQMESLDVNSDVTSEAWNATFTETGSGLTWSN